MFCSLNQLVDAARARGTARIAVAAGHDPDVIAALKEAEASRLAESTFVGDSQKIRAAANEIGFQIPEHRIVHDVDESAAARKAIGLISDGKADPLMKGTLGTGTLLQGVFGKSTTSRTR